MPNVEQITQVILTELKRAGIHVAARDAQIPISISGRHLHLSREDLDTLFGAGFELEALKAISQPGQYASRQMVTLTGPGGAISNLRVLGPVRSETQVELAMSDARRIGLTPPVRASGELSGSPGAVLTGPAGSVVLKQGVIVAQRHIHMIPQQAAEWGLADGQTVRIRVDTPKGGVLDAVQIHVRDDFALDMHLDADDANAMLIGARCFGALVLE